MVRDGSVVCPGSDAAVLRIKGIRCRNFQMKNQRQKNSSP